MTRQQYTYSGKNSPCPICDRTKDQDCRFNDEVVLCHSNIDQDAEAEGWVYRGSTGCGTWGQYFPKQEKPHRPKQSREFIYYDRNQMPMVKVCRIDKGDGTKKIWQESHVNGAWRKGISQGVHSKIPLYRIYDPINQQAISRGENLFIVEGEGKVDLLISLGIPATTAIGGAGKWKHYGHHGYLSQLQGAKIVLAPDRDEPGVKHCELIAEEIGGTTR